MPWGAGSWVCGQGGGALVRRGWGVQEFRSSAQKPDGLQDNCHPRRAAQATPPHSSGHARQACSNEERRSVHLEQHGEARVGLEPGQELPGEPLVKQVRKVPAHEQQPRKRRTVCQHSAWPGTTAQRGRLLERLPLLPCAMHGGTPRSGCRPAAPAAAACGPKALPCPPHLPNLEPSVGTPSVVAAAFVISSRFCGQVSRLAVAVSTLASAPAVPTCAGAQV